MSERAADGYRRRPVQGLGPLLRSDVVEVLVLRGWEGVGAGGQEANAGVELLQLRRAKEPLLGTWQPVMGHVEAGETAVMAAVREVEEEVGLTAQSAAWGGMWALEQVHPFYIAAIDAIVLSPRFVVLVRGGGAWSARLNAEHDGARWVGAAAAILPGGPLMWPGQRAALAEVVGALKAAEGDPASRGLPGAQRVG